MNILGTDDQARDVFARALYGFRISVLFGLILTACVRGHRRYGGRATRLFRRLARSYRPAFHRNLVFGTRRSICCLIMSSILPPGFWILLGIMLLFSWVSFVGIVRAEFLRARNFEYVNAARALGVPDRTIMFRHLLPNAMVTTLTFLPFILNGSITTLTSLDFLGFGLPPGSASLGELLAQGKNNLQAPWLGHYWLRRHFADVVAADLSSVRRHATPLIHARLSNDQSSPPLRPRSLRCLHAKRAGNARG